MSDITVTEVLDTPAIETHAAVGGGGLEGAERATRETFRWRPSTRSADGVINGVKGMADARGRDTVQNDGKPYGAVGLHRDTIVGSQFKLNARPNLVALQAENKAFDETWLEEMRTVVEARFELLGESESCWLDAQRRKTFTGMCRLAVAGQVITGEILATSEWIKEDRSRPIKTAMQFVSPARLTNPNGMMDTQTLRRGIQMDLRGRPLVYNIRQQDPGDVWSTMAGVYTWNPVPAEKPWGRKMVFHIQEPILPDQSRGVSDMVAVLSDMRMTKQYKKITLQQAIVQAMYAAAVESELPPEVVSAMMGGNSGKENFMAGLSAWMEALQSYVGSANNISIDGVAMPHLFPGTKLNVQALGTPGGLGTDFESSLDRNICAALNISYEEYSRNFDGVSYSGARASMGITARAMKAKKKMGADRFANCVYGNVFEEEMANGDVPLPVGVRREFFYRPLMREALTRASWIGAGAGQIDELKETQAAILRVKAGFTSYEQECARFGNDFREVFEQRAREEGIIKRLNLPFSLDVSKNGSTDQNPQQDTEDQQNPTPRAAPKGAPAKPGAKK
jgi:lambda family phage portal protein